MGLKGNINSDDRDKLTQDMINALKEKFPLLNDLSGDHEVSSGGISTFRAPGFRYSVCMYRIPLLKIMYIIFMHYLANLICRSLNKTFAVVIFFFTSFKTVQCHAQDTLTAPATRQEVWPEIDVFYRFNDKFRLFTSLSATQLKSSSYADGGFTVNLDYFALPVWRKESNSADSARNNLLWLRGGFLYSTSPPTAEESFKEYTITTEANARFYLPHKFLLTNKNRIDWRFVNGDFVPRYRPRFTLEKDLKTDFLTFNVYAYVEYFVNFSSEINNRFRYAFGSELRVAKHINFEVYFVHQFDNGLQVSSVNAAGFALKIYWQKGDRLFAKKHSQ